MYRFIWKIKLYDDVSESDFIKHWHDSSAILQEFTGAQGTIIHRARGEEKTFILVATWKSQSARDAMQNEIDKGDTQKAKRWQKFAKNDSFGDIQVRFAGEEIGLVKPKS